MSFFLPLIALCSGIVLGSYIGSMLFGVIAVLAGCGIYLYILTRSKSPTAAGRFSPYHKSWIFLLFAGVGFFVEYFNRPYIIDTSDLNSYIKAEGTVSDIRTTTSGDRLIIDIQHLADTTGKVVETSNLRLLVSSDAAPLEVGDKVDFPCTLRRIEENPNYRSTGYSDRLNKGGIYYQCETEGSRFVRTGSAHFLLATSVKLRTKIITLLEKSSLSRPACNFIIALLLGDRSFIHYDTKEIFNDAGMAHVLALSGMHIAIITILLMYLLYPLRLLVGHNVHGWSVIAILWIYVFLTGGAPSTIRAAIMATVALTAISLQRKNQALNSLFIAAFIILLLSPHSLYDIGLQLSFVCVGSIIIFANYLNPVDRHAHNLTYNTVSAVIMTLVATGASWVITAHYFQRVPLQFLGANFLLLPLYPFFIGLALLYIVALLFGCDLYFLSYLLSVMYDFLVGATGFLSGNGQSVANVSMSAVGMMSWLAGLVLLAWPIVVDVSKKKIFVMSGLLCLLFSVASVFIVNEKGNEFIIQNYRDEVSVMSYVGESENHIKLPRNSIGKVILDDTVIVAVDCRMDSTEMNLLDNLPDEEGNALLVIASGYRGNTLSDIPNLDKYRKIILHSSLSRKMEQRFMTEAQELSLDNIYSLRVSGPFVSSREIFFTNK